MTSIPQVAERAEAHFGPGGEGFSNKGQRNRYICQRCRGSIDTIDIDWGVTPFMTRCRINDRCGGEMKSSFYRVGSPAHATHEWYRPSRLHGLSPAEISHVMNGGLLLRESVKPDAA